MITLEIENWNFEGFYGIITRIAPTSNIYRTSGGGGLKILNIMKGRVGTHLKVFLKIRKMRPLKEFVATSQSRVMIMWTKIIILCVIQDLWRMWRISDLVCACGYVYSNCWPCTVWHRAPRKYKLSNYIALFVCLSLAIRERKDNSIEKFDFLENFISFQITSQRGGGRGEGLIRLSEHAYRGDHREFTDALQRCWLDTVAPDTWWARRMADRKRRKKKNGKESGQRECINRFQNKNRIVKGC